MPDTHDPIQQMLISARRTQILDAATTVFAEKGFHHATIKDIARQAGIADGTIYTYFASKTEVLLAILNRLNETTEREQQFARGSEQDVRSFFRAYLQQRIALLWPNAEVFRAVLPEMLVNAELRDLYYQQVLAPTFAIGEQFFQAQGGTNGCPVSIYRSRCELLRLLYWVCYYSNYLAIRRLLSVGKSCRRF
jgi:AcrR family transcriptional regulator